MASSHLIWRKKQKNDIRVCSKVCCPWPCDDDLSSLSSTWIQCIIFPSNCFALSWKLAERNQSNHDGQSKERKTSQGTNENSKWKAGTNDWVGKRKWSSRDWFWFYIWFVLDQSKIRAKQKQSKTNAIQDYSDTELRIVWHSMREKLER